MSDRSLPIGAVRPRRLRQSAAMRRLTSETKLQPEDLIEVLFVKEELEAPVDLTSMPGVRQHTLDSLVEAAERAVEALSLIHI